MSGINDFALRIGTVNGTGSASANALLMQSMFRMGIPVSGKNIFPSNIQGLPTWYEIRVSKDGYTGRPAELDLVVALNSGTYARDVAKVRPGGYLMYDSTWPMEQTLAREGVTIIGIPFGGMCAEAFTGDRERTLLRNIAYAGSLAALLAIDMNIVGEMLREQYGRKPKLLDSNFKALRMGFDYAQKCVACPLPFHLERMDATSDCVLLDGNTASALGCVWAGATVGAWYPITPATSLMEAFKGYCTKYRTDKETGEKKFCIVQAEDELSSAGIVIGAGWAGARAFTSTAGPGISLMQEFIGLAYYTEVPSVFFDVQRGGPATGMPTRTQQSDLLSIAYASHGDTKHLMLFPSDPGECFAMAVQAFDLAEHFQTPVFVVSDLDIGMNDWMVKRLAWDESYKPDRGKVLSAAELEGMQRFSRYFTTDADGVAARTLPGVGPKGAYFTRGSSHDKHAAYTEDAAEYLEVVDRLKRKVDGAADHVPAPEVRLAASSNGKKAASVGVISLGGCHAAVLEAMDRLQDQGIACDYMRIRGFPFPASVKAFIDGHETVFVVEQNRDAQLRSLLTLETGVARDQMMSVLDYGGEPLTAGIVVSGVSQHFAGVPA
jgi:2-oxoglutarate ferredoxin oxidoreductase subunit alpha